MISDYFDQLEIILLTYKAALWTPCQIFFISFKVFYLFQKFSL